MASLVEKIKGTEKDVINQIIALFGVEVADSFENQIMDDGTVNLIGFPNLEDEDEDEMIRLLFDYTDILNARKAARDAEWAAKKAEMKKAASIRAPKAVHSFGKNGTFTRYETLPAEIQERIVREEKRFGYRYYIDEGTRFVYGKLRDLCHYLAGQERSA